MNVRKSKIKGLRAYTITTDGAEIGIVVSMGPRILSLKRPSGKEIMHQNPTSEPDYEPQQWRGMGGGRDWMHGGPVADEIEASYADDNGRCEVSEDAPNCFTVWGAVHEGFSLQRGLTIRDNTLGGFDVTYMLRNRSQGGMLLYGGLWAIAALNIKNPAGGAAIGILTNDIESNWQVGDYRIVWHWGGRHHTTTGFMKEQLSIRDCLLVVNLRGHEGKIMVNSPVGAIIATNDDTTFIKAIETDPRWNTSLPGGRFNTAIYTCATFAESETMGPAVSITADQTVCHTERWVLTEPRTWSAHDLHYEVKKIKAAPFINAPYAIS